MNTGTPAIVGQVFDGANAMIEGGKAIANMAFTTFDTLNNIQNNPSYQPADGMFSRRDVGYQQPQQAIQYQPAAYPWASHQSQYGYGQQPQLTPGYSGITNPNYGKPGFFGGGGSFGTAFSTYGMPQTRMSNWFDKGIWG
jgi:hypothetical protein